MRTPKMKPMTLTKFRSPSLSTRPLTCVLVSYFVQWINPHCDIINSGTPMTAILSQNQFSI